MNRTALIMAGGTGGHIYPGLAVAECLRSRGWDVVWLGNASGMEARIVPQQGYPCEWIQFGALRGKGVLTKLLLPFSLLKGFAQAWRVLRRVKPDVVLGLGGYVTFPGGMMAVLQGVPLVLHEQNSVAGLANRVLAKVADKVLGGFPNALPNAEWVGNPVREEIAALPVPEQRFAARTGPLNVLVVGGSLGAAALNDVMPKALAALPRDERPKVVHQAGRDKIVALQAAYRVAGVDAETLPFIDNMAQRYAEADLVICRAGALTVAELACAGVASILVPYPYAVDDHQTGNAHFLSTSGAAMLLPQHQLTPEYLQGVLRQLQRDQLMWMAQRAREVAQPAAANKVADVCEAVSKAVVRAAAHTEKT